jgi:RNA polymerase sigma-70 factor, ECF subfamily
MLARRREARTDFEAAALVHLDALYGAAYRLARNPRDAEDLVQDTLLRAYRFWETFEKDSNCKAWLLRILTNTFINEYQRKKRSREVIDAAAAEQDATDGVLHHVGADTQKSPERLLLDRSVSDDVQRALEALPDDFRTAVVLCDIEGLSYKEIAEAMDCPVGTVMSRLFRGRKLLAGTLKEFAVTSGYVKNGAPAPKAPASDDAADAPIDLSKYRSKTREGSR